MFQIAACIKTLFPFVENLWLLASIKKFSVSFIFTNQSLFVIEALFMSKQSLWIVYIFGS